MRWLKSCAVHFSLWLLCAASLTAVMFAARPIYHRLWLPVGVTDAELVQVAGDNYAFTSTGRYYQNLDGHWNKVTLQSRSERPIWGMVDGHLAAVVDRDGVFYGKDKLPLPPLTQPLLAIGGAKSCSGEDRMPEFYAASASELALYNWTREAWMAFPLSNTLSAPVSMFGCMLLSLSPAGDRINSIEIKSRVLYDQDGITLSEFTTDLSSYGGAVEIVSSSQTVWMLGHTGKVYRLSRMSAKGVSWEALPTPPRVLKPRLIAGLAGEMFIEEEEYVDLWLAGEGAAYRLDRENRAWERFGAAHGQQPLALSSLTVNSDMGGTTVTRLAVVDGKLYRQQPVVAGLTFGLIIIGVPLMALIAIPISVLLDILFDYIRRRSS